MTGTVMHGAGNSFVLTENLRGELQGEDLKSLALRLCREAAADGLIVLVPAADADCGMLFFNADGSVGEMCGNGARCLARYAVARGLARDARHIRIRAAAGLVRARRLDEERYEVRLNDPTVIDLHRPAEALGGVWDCAYVELGDPGLPHAVLELPEAAFGDPDTLRALGRALRWSPAFPKGANVSFVCPLGGNRVRAVTYERGVEDFTLSCGTGSGSIAVSLILRGTLAGEAAEIVMPGGTLSVRLTRAGDTARDVFLSGPTAVVGVISA